MTRVMRPLSLALLLLACAPAVTRAQQDCDSPDATQLDLNQCAFADFEAADRELNSAYAALRTVLTAEEQTALREVQRAWLRFRDLECDFVASKFRGGSAEPLLLYGCQARASEQRTEQLRDEFAARGGSAPSASDTPVSDSPVSASPPAAQKPAE